MLLAALLVMVMMLLRMETVAASVRRVSRASTVSWVRGFGVRTVEPNRRVSTLAMIIIPFLVSGRSREGITHAACRAPFRSRHG